MPRPLSNQEQLIESAGLNQVDIVRDLITSNIDVNQTVEDASPHSRFNGKTALVEAAFWGRAPMIELLLQAKANINLMGTIRTVKRETPLTAAADMTRAEAARLLLLAGADASIPNSRGRTAADIATRKADYPINRPLKELFNTAPGSEGEQKISEPISYADTLALRQQEQSPATQATGPGRTG